VKFINRGRIREGLASKRWWSILKIWFWHSWGRNRILQSSSILSKIVEHVFHPIYWSNMWPSLLGTVRWCCLLKMNCAVMLLAKDEPSVNTSLEAEFRKFAHDGCSIIRQVVVWRQITPTQRQRSAPIPQHPSQCVMSFCSCLESIGVNVFLAAREQVDCSVLVRMFTDY